MAKARRQKPVARPVPAADVSRDRAWVLLPALLLAVCLAYQPAWRGGLLWDDVGHVTRPELASADGLRRIWTEPGASQQYYPLLHSAFWVEHRVWSGETAGYHAVNLAQHALSAFLLVLILRRLRAPGAVLAGVIFALHPLQVESVAWISEQKNTLSGAFALGATLVYLRFDDERGARVYVGALLLFLLAMLSKTTAAVFPVGLLIVLWWKRGAVSVRRDVVPLLPFAAAAAAGGVMTAWVERTFLGANGPEFHFSPIERVLIAGRALWFYLGKLGWPAPLVFNYPRWTIDATDWTAYLFPAAAVVVLAAAYAWRKRSRAPFAGALLYAVALSPALGFVDVFPFRYSFVADHFAYLAVIPFAACVAALATAIVSRRWPGARSALPALTAVTALLLGASTWVYSHDYQNAEAHYRATIRRNPSSWLAQNNLGRLLLDEGRDGDAGPALEAAVRLRPGLSEPHGNLGLWHLRQGRAQEAVAPLETAIRLDPNYAAAHYNLATALEHLGRGDEALTHFADAARLRPDSPDAEFHLGNLLHSMGRPAEAVPHYQAALKARASDAALYNNLGAALAAAGRLDEADAAFAEALRLKPDFDQARNNLTRLRALRQPR